jgi:hypothetical protein
MRLWPALILAPCFALASISLGYALVTPACESSRTWIVHLSIVLFLVLSVGTTLLAGQALASARREFLPLVATWTGGFFSAVILAQWLTVFLIAPCMH